MLDYTKEELLELGAEITTREIYQQPEVWKETYRLYQEKAKEIQEFFEAIGKRHGYIKVILTGAGTSAYVGDTLVPYLQEVEFPIHCDDGYRGASTNLSQKRSTNCLGFLCTKW